MVRARKYALNLYISAALSLFSIARSCGNAKIAVKTGKNPQKTAMKKSNPACQKKKQKNDDIKSVHKNRPEPYLISQTEITTNDNNIPDLVVLLESECPTATREDLK